MGPRPSTSSSLTRSSSTGFITSLSFIGAVLGALISILYDAKVGPRDELMVSALVCCIGTLGEGLIGLHAWTDVWYLAVFCAARLTFGLGMGVAMQTVPLFLAELSPPAYRGSVGSCEELFIVAALTFAYLLGGCLPNAFMGYFAPALAAIIALLTLPLLPRSPRYLLSRCYSTLAAARTEQAAVGSSATSAWAGTRAEVLAALRFSNPSATELDVGALVTELAEERKIGRGLAVELEAAEDMSPPGTAGRSPVPQSTVDGGQIGRFPGPAISLDGGALAAGPGVFTLLRWLPSTCGENGSPTLVSTKKGAARSVMTDPRMRQPLKITLGLILLQQGCGSTALLMYAGVVLKDMGVDVAVGVAAAGILKLSCTVAAAFAMDCAGRRPLLPGGTLGMLLATAMLSAGCCAGLDTTGGRAVALTGFYLLVAAYELSMGPVAWVLMGELFPALYRREAASLAICTTFTMGAAVTMALPGLRSLLGYGGLFACFAAICFVGLIFLYNNVIETKRLSLAQVQAVLLLSAY